MLKVKHRKQESEHACPSQQTFVDLKIGRPCICALAQRRLSPFSWFLSWPNALWDYSVLDLKGTFEKGWPLRPTYFAGKKMEAQRNELGQRDPASNTLTKPSASAFPNELDFELVLADLWNGGYSASELKQNSEACPC